MRGENCPSEEIINLFLVIILLCETNLHAIGQAEKNVNTAHTYTNTQYTLHRQE